MQANDVNLIEVKNQYGHRDQEIDQLHVLLNHFSVPLLFVTGTHGTGKSSVTRKILQNCSRGNWVWLDCDEFANVRLIYSHILARLFPTTESLDAPMAPSSFEQDSIDRLDQLDQSVRMQDSSVIMTPELGSSSPPNKSFLDATIQSIDETIATNEQLHSTNSCLNHLEFIEQLNWRLDQMLSHPDAESRCLSRFHIVLDNAEHLIRFDTLIGVLTRLTELVDCRATFSIVMISTHSFEYFRRLPGLVIEPYTLYFRPYSQDALTKLVVRLYPNHENRSLYEKFADLMIKTLYPLSRNLQEIQFICESQFEKHFLFQPDNQSDPSAKLWTAISHDFKNILASLSFKAENALTLYDELPVCAKYILIAAYCASYNSPKTDKRFFLKMQLGATRNIRKQAYTKQDQVPTGPKPFTLERLLHIYKALQELNEGHEFDQLQQKETTNHLLSQIMTFVSQKLLIKANSMSIAFPYLSSAKYRIADNVTNEFINGLAHSVNFNLAEHLERNIIKQ